MYFLQNDESVPAATRDGFRRIGLPTSLAELGLGGCSFDELHSASAFACRPDSDLHHLPFPVGEADLMAAMVSTGAGIASASPV